MKRAFVVPDEELLLKALKLKYGGGSIFKGVRRQRGSGIGSILQSAMRHVLPVLQKLVFPHATEAVRNIVTDVRKGEDLKATLKRNAKIAINKARDGLLNLTTNQTGGGRTARGKKRKQVITTKSELKSSKKRCCKGSNIKYSTIF